HGAFNELNSRKRGHMKKEISLVSGFLELCTRKRKRVWLHNIQP
ncbi:unnamed protein product, partial [Brassica oleracea]